MKTILCADDNEDDNDLLLFACGKKALNFRTHIVQDGQYAIDYLNGEGIYKDRDQYPLPALLLLDLKMPRKNGFEVLEWVSQRDAFRQIPIAVLSSSQNSADVEKAYRNGATWFLMKPGAFEDLLGLAETLNSWITTEDGILLQKLPFHVSSQTLK